jgi:hypothetical protein
MKPRDWFVVGVRLLGAWWFVEGVHYALSFLDVRLGLSPLRDYAGQVAGVPHAYLLYAAGYWAVAVYALFGTEHLARWCFQEGKPTGNAAEQQPAEDKPAQPGAEPEH